MLHSTTFQTSHRELVSQPIEPTWIRAGKPEARAVTLSESPDTLLTAGLWDCTAGTFTWIFGSDEIVHILEGEVRIRDGDSTHLLVPGDVAYFPRGLETVWEVPVYVKKSFILRAPRRGRIRRAAAAVRRGIKALAGR